MLDICNTTIYVLLMIIAIDFSSSVQLIELYKTLIMWTNRLYI